MEAKKIGKRIHNGMLAGCLLAAGILCGCDEHRDFPDTRLKVGHILCTDGKTVSFEEYKTSGREAIAVVFFVNNSAEKTGNGYAVYLYDLPAEAFADSTGVSQGTSADLTAYDGSQNTSAMFITEEVYSPIAQRVFRIWWDGKSADVPSVAEMRLLYAAKATINPYIIACGGDPLPDEADECWYWTSTEVEGQETTKAWLYSLSSGAIHETPKEQAHKVRAVVTLNE